MKEITEYLCDEFVDFNGVSHKFILCALSRVDNDAAVTFHSVNGILTPVRTLSLGYSVCNNCDTYNEEIGKTIAYNRARNDKFVPEIISTAKGIINTKLVKTILESEAEFIKRNPDSIIPGYNEKLKKMQEKKEAEERLKLMTAEEQQLVEMAKRGYDLDYYAQLAKTLNK